MKKDMKKFKAKKKNNVDFEFVGVVLDDDTSNSQDTSDISIDQSRDEEETKAPAIKNSKSVPAKAPVSTTDKKEDEEVANMIEKQYADYVLTLEGFLDDEENVSDEDEQASPSAATPKFINVNSNDDRENVYGTQDKRKITPYPNPSLI
jgi:hypothetical protein